MNREAPCGPDRLYRREWFCCCGALAATALSTLFASCSNKFMKPDLPTENGFRLGSLRMPPDGIAVMVAVVPLTESDLGEVEALWSEWDTQAIGLMQRRAWDDNGMRIAVAPTYLPSKLLQILDQPAEEGGLPAATPETLGPVNQKSAWRVTLREGKTKLIALTPVYPLASWTLEADGRTSAGSGDNVAGFVRLVAFPQTDGSVRFVLRPLLRHGQLRNRIGVLDDSLSFETSQNETELNQLRVDLVLRPGQTIVATCSSAMTDLSKLLFATPDSIAESTDDLKQRLLLIRLVQTSGGAWAGFQRANLR